MIAFDTNLVVRLMVEDDERQAKVALSILDNAVEKSEKVLVTDIVLSELEWVLDSAYRVPRLRLLAAIQRLAADNRFVFEDQERLTNALARYQDGTGDLSEYLLGLKSREAGASTTYTFDRALRGEGPFTVV